MPNRPKSISATSPGAVSSIRTVVWLRRRQFRFRTKRAQRRIRYRTPPRCQQLPDAGQLQPVTGEPLVNLVRPRLQLVLPGRHRLPRPWLPNRRQPAQLLRGGNQPIPNDALLLGCCHVLGDGISRQAGAQRNLALAIPRLPNGE